jgi:hypothetical protein
MTGSADGFVYTKEKFMKKLNLILLSICISCHALNTFSSEEAAAAPQESKKLSKKDSALSFLRTRLQPVASGWFNLGWVGDKKTPYILDFLRKGTMKKNLTTRVEHDLDWVILGCMESQKNDVLLEVLTRCAEQEITINESTLRKANEYLEQQSQKEYAEFQKQKVEAFTRIKEMKGLRQLVESIQAKQPQQEQAFSDVEDYTDEYIFGKTKSRVTGRILLLPADDPQ